MIAEWGPDDVVDFLIRINMVQYEETFRTNKITGKTLLSERFNNELLKLDLEVDAAGDRIAIMDAVEDLRRSC